MHLVSTIISATLIASPAAAFVVSPSINKRQAKVATSSTNGENVPDFDPLLSPHAYPNGIENGAVSDESVTEERSENSFGFQSIGYQQTIVSSGSSGVTAYDDFDPTLSPHSYPDGIGAGVTGQGKLGILLIDHGSKRQASNDHLHYLAKIYQYRYNEDNAEEVDTVVVRGAHMEIATPSILTSLRALITVDQVTKIVCVPYFLSPGRHATTDVPNLIEEAKIILSEEGVMALDSNAMVDVIVSDALGTHTESMLGAVDKLVDLALDRSGSSK